MDGTPLALERIRSAWPGLVLTDRIYLLSVLLADLNAHPNALIWKRQRGALVDLALEDENAYIRYLAAQHIPTSDRRDSPEVLARIEKVDSDVSQLVRSARQEAGLIPPPFKVILPKEGFLAAIFSDKYDAALFWTLHPIYRLAVATFTSWEFSIADPLRYAAKELLPNGKVTAYEMADVLLQFLGADYVQRFAKKEPRANRSPYHFDKEVEELWNLIPDIPREVSGILLECLPGGDKHSPIPPGIVESLDDQNLANLLWRDNVEFKELRRKIYVESDNKQLRCAAIASAKFELLDSDISSITSDDHEREESRAKKVEELLIIAKYCRGASLVQMEAVYLYLDLWKSYYFRSENDALQTERAKRLWNNGIEHSTLQREVLQLRVFELAKFLSPMKKDEKPCQLPKSLKQYQKLIVPTNPWQTYLNLWLAVDPVEWKKERDDLPSVWIRDFSLPDEI